MASPRTTCDTALMTHFPSLVATMSVSTMAYAIHLSVALSTLFLLVRQEVKNPHRTKHIAFIAMLLAAGTANIVVYLHSTVFCDQRMREHAADENRSYLRYCLEDSSSNSTACLERDFTSFRWQYESFEAGGMDLTRGQHVTAMFIGLLSQCYLLLRCHLLLGRKLVTGSLTLLLCVVISFSVINLVFNGSDMDVSSTAADHYIESTDFLSIGGAHLTRISWGLAIAYNLTANIVIIGRLLLLRARVTSVLGRDFSRIYTGLASMLLESSALYTGVLIVAYTTLPGLGGTWSLFSPLVAQTEAISVELITLRIALGRAMSRRDIVTVTARRHDADPNNPDSEAALEPKSESSSSTDATRQDPAPSSAARRVRIRRTIRSTFSQFPSSVAAVLKSHRGEDSRRGEDTTRTAGSTA